MNPAEQQFLRAQCDERRAKHQATPATSAFACAICPASYVCAIPNKKRAVLFAGNNATDHANEPAD